MGFHPHTKVFYKHVLSNDQPDHSIVGENPATNHEEICANVSQNPFESTFC